MAMDDTARPSSAPRASLTDDNAHVGSLLSCVATLSQGNYMLIRTGMDRDSRSQHRVWRITVRLRGGAAKTTSGAELIDALDRAVDVLTRAERGREDL